MPSQLRRAVATALLLATAHEAHAAGFALIEQSASGLGNAYAGGAASAEDASTIFFNPAGLTRLKGQEFSVVGHYIAPRAEFSDEGSYINRRMTGGQALPGSLRGGDGGDGGEDVPVPNFYYARKLGEVSLGLGLYSPYGLVTDYDKNWIGRYHALRSDLRTVNLAPTVAFKANESLSIGAGLQIQHADVELSNAIDFGAVAAASGVPGMRPGAADGKSTVSGDNWAVGFNLGLLYAFDADTRLGLAYRSQVEQEIEGERELVVPAVLQAVRPSGTIDATAEVTLPDQLSLSLYRQAGRWAFMGDITWTGWSSFDELRIVGADGSVSVQPEKWEDAMRYSAGVSLRATDAWTLRGGIAYDESPVPDAEHRTPRIPDADRTWLALGASWQANPELRLDFGYAHLFVPETKIRNTEVTTGHTLVGEYSSSVDILSAQLTWSFD